MSFHNTNFHSFTPATSDVALTVFNPDGSRLVVGPLGTVRYDAEGNAEWSVGSAPGLSATIRSDLGLGERWA